MLILAALFGFLVAIVGMVIEGYFHSKTLESKFEEEE